MTEESLLFGGIGLYEILAQGSEYDQTSWRIDEIQHLRGQDDRGNVAEFLPSGGPESLRIEQICQRLL